MRVILTILIMVCFSTVNAQLFEDNELYPNIKTIKEKYYNGSGGGGYWSLERIDTLGRVAEKESYLKDKLLSKTKYIYNSHNDKLFSIQTFDINNPSRIDSFKFEYKYSENRIIYQYRKLSDNDSTITELTENVGDSILTYQKKEYYFRPKTRKTDVYEMEYTLRYKGGLLISNEILNKENNSKEFTTYEYYDNGRLKRRVIERIPKPEQESFYVGGPGSDYEYYEYKLDSKGRVIKFYRIINNNRYKIATYRYNEK